MRQHRIAQQDAEKRVSDAINTMKRALDKAHGEFESLLGFLTGAILILGAATAWWAAKVGGRRGEEGTILADFALRDRVPTEGSHPRRGTTSLIKCRWLSLCRRLTALLNSSIARAACDDCCSGGECHHRGSPELPYPIIGRTQEPSCLVTVIGFYVVAGTASSVHVVMRDLENWL